MFHDDIYNCYETIYDGITDEEWVTIADQYDINVDDLKVIFSVKEGENEILTEFINEWIEDEFPIMRSFLESPACEDLLDCNLVKEIFFNAMGKYIEDHGIDDLINPEEQTYWTCVIAEGILLLVYEVVLAEISPNSV